MSEIFSWQPLWVILIPLATALFLIAAARIPWLRHTLSICGGLATLAAVLTMWPAVMQKKIIVCQIALLISPLNLTFRVDGFSVMVALITAFVWLAATIYAVSYMDHEQNRGRFFVFLAITFAGTIGVPLAGDFISLLVFFEVMTLASYVLVIHNQSDEAISAGNLYLYLGVFGGLCLLTGIILLQHFMGTLVIAPNLTGQLTPYHLTAIVCLIVGFGIKAGMAPLHIWLPRAHPVAPSPASALLSGVMIKVGAYGIIRTVAMFFTPSGEKTAELASLWEGLSTIGYVLIWIGIGTALFGAFMALFQDNMKKMLACSSISQMGFIILGVGVAGYLCHEGAVGLAAASYHILNHALFKSLLFLAAGVFAFQLGELDMYKLGGLWKKMPFTAAAAMIGTLGIVGIPFFNGYASKTLLHHALAGAFTQSRLPALQAAEWLFVLASAGTACYFIKFIYLVFFRKAKRSYGDLPAEPLPMKIGMTMLSAAIVGIGLFPNQILDRFILPALTQFRYDPGSIETHLTGIKFWTWPDFGSVGLALVAGVIFFALGVKSGAFQVSFPVWLGQEYAGTMVGRAAIALWGYLSRAVSSVIYFFKVVLANFFKRTFILLQRIDYRPGRSKLFRTINFGNIDFDAALVIVILGAVLVYLFYLNFGFVNPLGG